DSVTIKANRNIPLVNVQDLSSRSKAVNTIPKEAKPLPSLIIWNLEESKDNDPARRHDLQILVPLCTTGLESEFSNSVSRLSVFTNPVKTPDIRFSSSQFRKQHQCLKQAVSLMNPYGNIIEGIGNELLFVISCMGTILFLIAAWISTRVNWELMPVRITLLRHPHRNHDTVTETTNAPRTVEPDNIDSSGNIFSETSGSSSEDEIDSDTCIHKRSSVQTSITSNDQRNSSSSDEESKTSRTKEKGQINSTSCFNGHLVIKLQYLNEESRFVHASPTMSVNRFK
ncbi:unnamed protein product, partial [Schistosoma margrebowiei]